MTISQSFPEFTTGVVQKVDPEHRNIVLGGTALAVSGGSPLTGITPGTWVSASYDAKHGDWIITIPIFP
jgi:hypothetical protein